VSDRLAELKRQRALLQEHVAWLDREITAEQIKTSQPANVAAPAPQPSPAAAANPAPSATPDADALIGQYSSSPESLQSDVRKGCFLYFAIASIALIALVTVLYFTLSRK
jgi:hypothetical protein